MMTANDADSHHAALSLLSLAGKNQSTVMTLQDSRVVPRLESLQQEYAFANGGPQSTPPLMYVGVTLERPAASNNGWGMTLFQMSNHYAVVGGIEQDVMQRHTSWAWVTVSPPKSSSGDFRSSFVGPLYPTSLLQLVPGDVILSINGKSLDSLEWHTAPRLDIVAVRCETARGAATQVLSSMNHVHCNKKDAECRAARAAFETIKPLLSSAPNSFVRRQFVPAPSVDQHQVTTAPTSSAVNEESSSSTMDSNSVQEQRFHSSGNDNSTLPLSRKETITETQVHEWLQVRKSQWRSNRAAKRRRCNSSTNKPDSVQTVQPVSQQALVSSSSSKPNSVQDAQSGPPQAVSSRVVGTTVPLYTAASRVVPSYTGFHDPLIYLCFKLERDSVATPWGMHVSHNDRHFLGVGRVNNAVSARTSWGWATASGLSSTVVLNATNEHVVRSFFQARPLDYSSCLCPQAGDFILSVCGRPISSFESLPDIANCMTQATEMIIIAVRHRMSSDVARQALLEGKNGHDVTDIAFRCILPILYRSPSYTAGLLPLRAPPAVYRKPKPEIIYRNPLFRDDQGRPILYEDAQDFEDGTRAAQFLPPISSESFPSWLKKRKATWREGWNIRPIDSDGEWLWDDDDDDSPSSASSDFWTPQGYQTFNDWLAASTFKWKQSYSWNRERREKVAKECEQVVHFPSHTCGRDGAAVDQGRQWLQVRKQQWRFLRRKRQRRWRKNASRLLPRPPSLAFLMKATRIAWSKCLLGTVCHPCRPLGFPAFSPRSVVVPRQTSGEMTIIDALIAEQESQQKALEERAPLDISFLFDATLGAPDDIVVHCLEYLPRSEHGKLLCVSTATSAAMKERDEVWRQLCPIRWKLPRRPRKRWHEIYVTKINEEVRASRKWADDFLNKASEILFKQDNLNQIEKLVKEGEKRVDFDINYISGVVCERNSLLNLAVIYSRSKVARWLIETKGADIETYDRGGFTPLLNAAWAGDRQLVRYLLSRGADRTKVGLFHFFEPLSSPDFKGLNAEGWAREKGHNKIAELISLGL